LIFNGQLDYIVNTPGINLYIKLIFRCYGLAKLNEMGIDIQLEVEGKKDVQI
jgi:hypothetical protein